MKKESSGEKTAYIYLLRCQDDTLYTGITTNLKRRVSEHIGKKKGAKYTRVHGVKALEAAFVAQNWSAAAKLEYAIKQLSKAEKEALVQGNPERLSHLEQRLEENYRNVSNKEIQQINQSLK